MGVCSTLTQTSPSIDFFRIYLKKGSLSNKSIRSLCSFDSSMILIDAQVVMIVYICLFFKPTAKTYPLYTCLPINSCDSSPSDSSSPCIRSKQTMSPHRHYIGSIPYAWWFFCNYFALQERCTRSQLAFSIVDIPRWCWMSVDVLWSNITFRASFDGFFWFRLKWIAHAIPALL